MHNLERLQLFHAYTCVRMKTHNWDAAPTFKKKILSSRLRLLVLNTEKLRRVAASHVCRLILKKAEKQIKMVIENIFFFEQKKL